MTHIAILRDTTARAPTTSALQNADGSLTVTVSATAAIPTCFARVLGWRVFRMMILKV
ncbi:MAG TPA: hypothetical protein VMJ66_09380 [Geobacteraceae bacterium]|nr:hypothetical protein [Geobacteraceae bacterium]